MAKKAVKKKKTKGIFENRLSIVFITMVVVSMSLQTERLIIKK